MPRVVDHDLRRKAIVEATCDVIATEGLDAATMRRIAQRAGSTTGLVTHYFESKRAVLIASLRYVHRAAGQRMLAAVETSPPDARLRAVIEESLPLDPARMAEWRIWLAFWAQAAIDPELGHEQRARYAEWMTMLDGLLRQADSPAHVDDLIALIDGIGIRAVLAPEQFPADRQLAAIDRLFGHRQFAATRSPSF